MSAVPACIALQRKKKNLKMSFHSGRSPLEKKKGMFVAGNPPLLWQLVGEREKLELLQQKVPSEHPAQTQVVGGGWSRGS